MTRGRCVIELFGELYEYTSVDKRTNNICFDCDLQEKCTHYEDMGWLESMCIFLEGTETGTYCFKRVHS